MSDALIDALRDAGLSEALVVGSDANGAWRVLHEGPIEGAEEPPSPIAFAELVDADGARALDRDACAEVRAEAGAYDLFFDLLSPVARDSVRCMRRSERGDAEEVAVPRRGALALVELIERGVPLRAAELASLRGLLRPARALTRARRCVDVRVGRYRWRAFEHTGGGGEAMTFLFDPPEGFRWAALRAPASDRSRRRG